ncbi:MAG: hypothetical protein NXI10_07595 [bacterium]|nr:hypothetical protein [bacterium]
MLKTTSIFLFLLLLSCTVTKRVHRPGFHVEWKKNYKVQKDEVSTADIERSRDDRSGDDDQASVGVESWHDEKTSNSNDQALEARESTIRNEEKQRPKKSVKVNEQVNSVFIKQKRKFAPLKLPKFEKSSSSQASSFTGDGFLYVGYAMLGLGAYLLIGVLFSYFGFWILENLFYSLVFSGNGIIAGILGFFLFLIILLLVFIAYAIVHYLLGGAYIGFIVSVALIGAGLVCLLIGSSF